MALDSSACQDSIRHEQHGKTIIGCTRAYCGLLWPNANPTFLLIDGPSEPGSSDWTRRLYWSNQNHECYERDWCYITEVDFNVYKSWASRDACPPLIDKIRGLCVGIHANKVTKDTQQGPPVKKIFTAVDDLRTEVVALNLRVRELEDALRHRRNGLDDWVVEHGTTFTPSVSTETSSGQTL